jgi:hypothetical protein
VVQLDIEVRERAILDAAQPWIDQCDALIVELHDRFVPGCARAFYRATESFGDYGVTGEKVWARRVRG